MLVVGFAGLAGCGRPPADDAPVEPVEPLPLVKPAPIESEAPAVQPSGELQPQTISFMGTRATGRRFCIIADRSMSLSPASFGRIRHEIKKTLDMLNETTPFHVMFFADRPTPMPGGAWASGKKDIDKVAEWMATVDRKLGTVAAPAFAQALALTPPPDIIFFMTDGRLQAKDPALVAAKNSGDTRVAIHTILFTTKAGEVPPSNVARAALERIAQDSGGTFRQFIAAEDDPLPKKGKKAKV